MLCRLCDGSLKPKQLGVLGEQYAADWLERHGYTILGRNWHSRYGELDIVMMRPTASSRRRGQDQADRPFRHAAGGRHPAQADESQTRGVQWLLEPDHRIRHTGVRFDVLTIVARAGMVSVHHIPGAF